MPSGRTEEGGNPLMSKVVTMGEIMLRLSTPNFERFIQADEFDIHYGG